MSAGWATGRVIMNDRSTGHSHQFGSTPHQRPHPLQGERFMIAMIWFANVCVGTIGVDAHSHQRLDHERHPSAAAA